jgi:hypothetical protein
VVIPLRRLWLWGFGYGVVIACLGMMTTGAGHGTTVLLAISSAPLGIINVGTGVFGAPFFWALAGWLLTDEGNRFDRLAFVLIALLHYGAAGFLTTFGGMNDWNYLSRTLNAAPAIVFAWAAGYGSGQLFLWCLFLAGPNRALHWTRWKNARQ